MDANWNGAPFGRWQTEFGRDFVSFDRDLKGTHVQMDANWNWAPFGRQNSAGILNSCSNGCELELGTLWQTEFGGDSCPTTLEVAPS